MAEQQVRLRKRSGGNTIIWEGHEYHWPADDPVLDVPYGLALGLLRIPDGGYTVDGDPEALPASVASPGGVQSVHAAGLKGSEEGAEPEHAEDDEDAAKAVTEPGPEAKHKVTEPAPPANHPADTAARSTQRAGTRRRPAAK